VSHQLPFSTRSGHTGPGDASPGIGGGLSPRQVLLALVVVVVLAVGYLAGQYGGSVANASAPAPVSAPTDLTAAPSSPPPSTTPAAPSSTAAAPTPTTGPVAAAPAPLARGGVLASRPVRIEIPDIGATSDLTDLFLNPDGTLQAPKDYQQVGWFADGSLPGATNTSPAIFAGHVDSFKGPAVFYDLDKLKPGAQVRVTQANKAVAVYVVTASAQYEKKSFPAAQIYRDRTESEIVLITCTGVFDKSKQSYAENLVVTARLDPALSSAAG